MGVRGRVQRQGDVTHIVAEHLVDLTHLLRTMGDRNEAFPLATGRGDEARRGSGPNYRDKEAPLGRKPREIYIPDLRLGSGIKVPTRDFR